ncbi:MULTISPECIES: PAS domain-containing sensor histidine kinase [Halolamina]|uniref:histidine kinase n=1 Tax=Halolamina pelagica TaxID=699431 RepID=A0A1I5MZG7_9EURY|nr:MULTISPECIES: ATP-binding protein [Halolamina]NHX36235.1 PAS domain S-box protein [Halolamina sp. R1-12]SFP14928.1 PAS domain S-box-containing protein [Halolamina pelagica]
MTDTANPDEGIQAVHGGQEFLDHALDVLDDVFYVLGPDGELLQWNDRAAEVTGYSEDEIAEMNAVDFLADDELALEAMEETLRTGEGVVESDLLTADGRRIPYEFTGARLTDERGETVGIAGIGRDISRRKEYEHQLTALHEFADELTQVDSAEEVYRRTIEASEDILEFDLSLISIEEDRVLDPVATSSGITPEGVIEMSVDEGIGGKTYRTGQTFVIDDLPAHPDSKPQGPYGSLISVPIGDYGNFQAVSGVTGAFAESDRKLAELLITHTENALARLSRETQLERQAEQLEKFAKVASHDLRNPLNVAQGRIELAQEGSDTEHLAAADRAVDRSLCLVEDLLTLAREGKQVKTLESVDLAGVARRCWKNVATDDGVLVVESERTVRADPGRLKQLLENLMRNAVEHGGSSVTVTIGDLQDGFYVADTGPGIPEADRENVFEPGYSTTSGGTGFGLNIVREISDAHEWEVRIRDADGGGARFEFTNVEAGY